MDKIKENEQKYDIADSFGWLMATASQKLRQRLSSRLLNSGFDITAEQWALMNPLWENKGMSQQELSRYLNRSKVAVLKLVKNLEKNGFIEKRKNPDDKRSYKIFLTDYGLKAQRKLNAIAKQNLQEASEGLSNQDIENFKKTLKKLVQNLNR